MFDLTSSFTIVPRSKDPQDPYARASRFALKAYANSIEEHDPKYAKDIRNWIEKLIQYNIVQCEK